MLSELTMDQAQEVAMSRRKANMFLLRPFGSKMCLCRRGAGRGVGFCEKYGKICRIIPMVKAYSNLQEDRVSRIEGKLEQLIDYITYVLLALSLVAI